MTGSAIKARTRRKREKIQCSFPRPPGRPSSTPAQELQFVARLAGAYVIMAKEAVVAVRQHERCSVNARMRGPARYPLGGVCG